LNTRPGEKKKKRVRIVAKKVQLKYAAMLAGILLFPLIITQVYVIGLLEGLITEAVSNAAAQRIQAFQLHILIFGLLYIAGVSVISLWVTNKIAGPLYRLEQDALNFSRKPDLNFRFRFRKKDEFQGVAAALNAMLERIKKEYGEDSSG